MYDLVIIGAAAGKVLCCVTGIAASCSVDTNGHQTDGLFALAFLAEANLRRLRIGLCSRAGFRSEGVVTGSGH